MSITASSKDPPSVHYTAASGWLLPYVDGAIPTRPVAPARRAFVTAHLVACLGGDVAERLAFGRGSLVWTHSVDLHDAAVCARLLGHGRDALRVVESFRPAARAILEARWHQVNAIARELVKHGAVKGTELRAIVRDATWRDVAHPLRTPGRRAA